MRKFCSKQWCMMWFDGDVSFSTGMTRRMQHAFALGTNSLSLLKVSKTAAIMRGECSNEHIVEGMNLLQCMTSYTFNVTACNRQETIEAKTCSWLKWWTKQTHSAESCCLKLTMHAVDKLIQWAEPAEVVRINCQQHRRPTCSVHRRQAHHNREENQITVAQWLHGNAQIRKCA